MVRRPSDGARLTSQMFASVALALGRRFFLNARLALLAKFDKRDKRPSTMTDAAIAGCSPDSTGPDDAMGQPGTQRRGDAP